MKLSVYHIPADDVIVVKEVFPYKRNKINSVCCLYKQTRAYDTCIRVSRKIKKNKNETVKNLRSVVAVTRCRPTPGT